MRLLTSRRMLCLTTAATCSAFMTPRSTEAQSLMRPKLASGPIRMLNSFFSKLIDESRIDYAALRGRPRSLGKEAGEWALKGLVPSASSDGFEVATFAGGCFWGTELHFQRLPGVIVTCVGYTQGKDDMPTYQEVCTGRSGHTEGIMLLFDPSQCTYESLCEKLLSTVDPSLLNQVGGDYGTQYRHGIYPHSASQMAVARRCIDRVQAKLPSNKRVHTEVVEAKVFWPAEEYHQQYLMKGGRFGTPQSVIKGCNDPVRCYG
uniref:peptide-methionine (S)-S-oxide reductase n=1 Tax=Haptolina ericina TaxID=156174 RepID=A0A7S3AQE3_9EUKA|mmetsp:Transcript_29181/g.66065  ORF Transcript_29181/g.66065 Transcript_29181/m.66065 type:complete len:261 (+) Transcript_29181:39-821(+)